MSLASTCLAAAEEEKQILTQDLQNLTLTKEMMIKKAWETRSGLIVLNMILSTIISEMLLWSPRMLLRLTLPGTE